MSLFRKKEKQEMTEEELKYLEEYRVADMNVEGMPWYNEHAKEQTTRPPHYVGEQLSKKEARMYVGGALLAGLVISAVFLGGMFLVVLFCVFIWL